jgi:hypothetical protein
MTAPAAAPTGLLDTAAACEFLGIKRTKLFELTKKGHLGFVSIPTETGKRQARRYERAELERFIATHRAA